MKTKIIILLGLTACCCIMPGAATYASDVVVGVAEVTENEDDETRHYTGQAVSRSVVHVVSRVSGEITKLGFEDGSAVRKGQMLYRLDPVQYEAAVKSAEAGVAKCKAELSYAQSNFDRVNLLYQKQASSLDSMESARSTLETAQAALLSAEAELISAKDDLKNTVITAPMDGIAGVTAFTEGNYISSESGTLVTLIQVQPVRVRFSISTSDLLEMFENYEDLKNNGVARVRLADGSAYDEAGDIELLNNEVNSRTDTIQVYANFPNKDRKLIPGSTLSVLFSRKNAKLLPSVVPSALMHDAQGAYVYVLDSAQKVEKRYVTLGNATAEQQLIKDGLQKGETVIVQGTHKAMPGMTVE